MAQILDITESRKAADALRYGRELSDIIASISTSFITLSSMEVDRGIDLALEAIGEFVGVDRTYVFVSFDEGKRMRCLYEWCAPGVTPQAP